MTELINIETLSKLTNISVSGLRKMCAKRKIPYVKISGRLVRFDMKEIEKWMKARTVTAVGVGQ